MKLNLFLLSAAAMVSATTAADGVDLGSAGDFVILSKTGIMNTPGSGITGDIAVSPIAQGGLTGFSLILDSSTEFSKSSELSSTSKVYAADYGSPTPSKLTTAVNDMLTAYTAAGGRPTTVTNLKEGKIGGETLVAGVYTFDTDIDISADLTFQGTSTDVFTIQTSKSVQLAAEPTKVILKNNDGVVDGDNCVKAQNIIWQVAQTVEVGAGAEMKGIILAKEKVVFGTGSKLEGRIFSQTAVTLQSAEITQTPVAPRRRLR
jgi:hypothetical protein